MTFKSSFMLEFPLYPKQCLFINGLASIPHCWAGSIGMIHASGQTSVREWEATSSADATEGESIGVQNLLSLAPPLASAH